MSKRVLIAGGGVGGLTAALAFGRAGHEVTLLERDELLPLATAEEAFATERRGAPQVHQTHGFLARIQVLLRDHFPDVLDDLIAAGATPMPMTSELGDPRPGDEDLKVIIVRRSTLEWVLRKAVERQPQVAFRHGVGVVGLRSESSTADGTPIVDGVHLDDDTTLDADLVVAALGRRGDIPGLLHGVGVDVPETIVESGLMYLSRWYRRKAGGDIDPKLGGDLGFVKFLGIPGDGDTLSVTLAVRTKDTALRNALSDPTRFDQACQLLPGPNQFFVEGAPPMQPIGGVRPMAGLLNRIRRFTDAAGRPTVVGFHAVGDCHTVTNPLYGRGSSLAAVQAVAVAQAHADNPGDAVAAAAQYEAYNKAEVEPWYDNAVMMDQMGADPGGRSTLGGSGTDAGPSDAAKAMGAVFAAAATDPVIGRGIARLMNLLHTPQQMMSDPELMARMAEVMANPDQYPTPPQEGPTRRELLAQLGHPASPDGELVA